MSFSDKLREFHEKFEMDIRDTPYMELFNDEKLLNLRMKLIEEEFLEMKEAVKNKDLIELIDSAGDLLYVIMGLGTSCGFDLDKAFNLIHESNMSKLCDTEEQATESVEWYKETRPEFTPAYRKTKDGSKWLVYDTLTGKVLKNKYYEAVDLRCILYPSEF
jgi:predicted HAD superfamily Cof-like phosphohydrolase